jgi:hypothetical protein
MKNLNLCCVFSFFTCIRYLWPTSQNGQRGPTPRWTRWPGLPDRDLISIRNAIQTDKIGHCRRFRSPVGDALSLIITRLFN